MSSNNPNGVFNKNSLIAIASGIGIGITAATLARGILSSTSVQSRVNPTSINDVNRHEVEQRKSVNTNARQRLTSQSDRGSVRLGIQRNHSQRSMTLNPIEIDFSTGFELCSELKKTMERVHSNMELVKNRSEKDKNRAQKTDAILRVVNDLEAHFNSLLPSLSDLKDDDVRSMSNYNQENRTRTLSVFSDDSFRSAVEEFATSFDADDLDINGEAAEMNESERVLLQQGLNAALNGEVQYRKSRAEVCQCESETDFAAKVYCLRKAFTKTFEDEHKRVWLSKCARSLLADFIRHSKQDPMMFFNAFDEMLSFLSTEANISILGDEVAERNVKDVNFYDVVVDFIILDAFDDLRNPPSTIYSVTKNKFMSYSMKYSTLNNVIWSMLKSKRYRLKNQNGFISKYYKVSEAIMPAIILGFLGTDERVGELCQYFKEQVTQFIMDVFNIQKVRYRNVEELSEDIWIVLRNRLEAVQTRLSSELLPA